MSKGDKDRLIAAVMDWASNCEGIPSNPNDAELLKAVSTFDGDYTEPCEGCDGDCGEPCAPYTVEAHHRSMDRFIAKWKADRGIAP